MHPRLANIAGHTSTAWIAPAIGILLSAAAAYWTATLTEREARLNFENAVADARDAIESRIRSYSDVLLGVRGLFIASDTVTRSEFKNYIDSLDLNRRYPGVQVIHHGQRVAAAQKQAFEAMVRNDTSVDPRGYPDFAVKPPGDRPQYVIVQYVEPMAGNEAALGLDLIGDAVRLAALNRTRDSGRITASGIIALALDPRRHPGFAMRLPVYRKGMPLATVAQRREAFTGVVSASFVVIDLMRGVLSEQLLQKIHVRIHDAGLLDSPDGLQPLTAKNLMFDSDRLLAAPASQPISSGGELAGPASMSSLDVGGRRWNVSFSPRQEMLAPSDRWLPLAVLLGGITISLLLFGLSRSLSTVGERAVMLAANITEELRQNEARLAESQRMTQELIEALPNPIYFKGTDSRYLGVNKAWEKFFGMSRSKFIGKTVHDLYPDDPELAKRLHIDDQVLWDRPGTKTYETVVTTPGGQRHDAIYYKATYTHADGSIAGLIGTIIDITERKQAERRQQMEHSVTRILGETATLAEATPRVIQAICETMQWLCGARWEIDREAGVLRCVEGWGIDTPEIQEFITGVSKRSLNADPVAGEGLVQRIYHSGQPLWLADIAREHLWRAPLILKDGLRAVFGFPLQLGGEVLGVMEFYHCDSRKPDALMLEVAGSIGNQIGQFIARKQAEERVRQLAHYDEVTRLANRNLFNQILSHALAQARRNGKPLAILFIDLDGFKNINDTLGHEAGDRVLTEIARRLLGCLRDGDTVSRFGGDEFVVLLEDAMKPAHSVAVAQKILTAVAAPIVIEAREFVVTASIGVSNYPADGDDMQSLLRYADAAMYRAKERGKNQFQFYSAPAVAPSPN